MFVVCFDHRLFTPASTPKGVDFCVHGRLYSHLKGSRAPPSGSSSIKAAEEVMRTPQSGKKLKENYRNYLEGLITSGVCPDIQPLILPLSSWQGKHKI